ncbi:hypothetical protein MesoLj131b_73870 (plasmid) [Mesorhizobium sp. 131-2-5]|nr:hypothetical protein MesoLj131b_73870 [Mesorhizobium sp. 131-2-5]
MRIGFRRQANHVPGDRKVAKFAYVEAHDCRQMKGAAVLRNGVEVVPFQIHSALTDNVMPSHDLPKSRDHPSRRFLGPHISDPV